VHLRLVYSQSISFAVEGQRALLSHQIRPFCAWTTLIERSCGVLLTVDFGNAGKRDVIYGERETTGGSERNPCLTMESCCRASLSDIRELSIISYLAEFIKSFTSENVS